MSYMNDTILLLLSISSIVGFCGCSYIYNQKRFKLITETVTYGNTFLHMCIASIRFKTQRWLVIILDGRMPVYIYISILNAQQLISSNALCHEINTIMRIMWENT